MVLFVNTSQLGDFSGQYQFNLSDEQDLSGWAGQQTQTLNVTANFVPEPSTLSLLASGVLALSRIALRRRRLAAPHRGGDRQQLRRHFIPVIFFSKGPK